MSTKMCRISNQEARPVIVRGRSGTSIHLGPLEVGREIRALELEDNPLVDKLKRRNVLTVEEIQPKRAKKKTTKKKTAKKKTAKKTGKKKAVAKRRGKKTRSTARGAASGSRRKSKTTKSGSSGAS